MSLADRDFGAEPRIGLHRLVQKVNMDLGAIEQFVRDKLGGEATGHDFHHCFRVRRTAELIARSERGCDPVVVGCASLLHDIPDPKICSDVEQATRDVVRVMQENGIDSRRIDHVVLIIGTLSFKGANVETPMATLEGKVVQDADRRDGRNRHREMLRVRRKKTAVNLRPTRARRDALFRGGVSSGTGVVRRALP